MIHLRLVVTVALVVLLTGAAACKRTDTQDRTGTERQTGDQGSKQKETPMLRFKTFSYVDREGIGIEAFRLLIPSDWKADGTIHWVLDNPGMPAVASFRVSDPLGANEFEIFPNQPFFWTNNPMVRQLFPVGSKYFGSEVRAPVRVLEALEQIVLRRFRVRAAHMQVVGEQLLPDLAKTLGAGKAEPGVSAWAEGGKIRIQYEQAGTPLEEEIYGIVESYSFPIQTMTGVATNTLWTVDYLFSFKAKKGALDAHAKLFQAIATSFRLNPQWFNKYTQVVEYLIKRQIQQIHSIGELSRIISQTHNEISESSLQSYYDRQAVYDRVAENFSQHIRGVDGYYDPYEQRTVELPSGYRHAWTNNLGEYILTEQEDFNPNIGSNLHWEMMDRK
jgi:hypothetical protein